LGLVVPYAISDPDNLEIFLAVDGLEVDGREVGRLA